MRVLILCLSTSSLTPSQGWQSASVFVFASLSIALKVDQATVASSNIWRAPENNKRMTELCVRVDLLDRWDGTSYNFYEQRLYVTIHLTASFTVSQNIFIH